MVNLESGEASTRMRIRSTRTRTISHGNFTNAREPIDEEAHHGPGACRRVASLGPRGLPPWVPLWCSCYRP